MKIISLAVLSSFLFLHIQAQAPRDMAYYLNNEKISKSAKDYYNGKYQAADDARTFSIHDSLKTRNSSTRPFYIYLVSKMMKKSDGSLSEASGSECRNFIEWHPDEVISYYFELYRESSKVDPNAPKVNYPQEVASFGNSGNRITTERLQIHSN